MSDAQMLHAEKMAKGEIEYKAESYLKKAMITKTNLYLFHHQYSYSYLGYSIFTDDVEIRTKLDLFFEYFNQLPYWYQVIFIGVVSAIYGLKGADIMRKK